MPAEAIVAIAIALGINGLVWGLIAWRLQVLKRRVVQSFEMQGERLIAGPKLGSVVHQKGIGRSRDIAVVAVSDRRLLAVSTFGKVVNVMADELPLWQLCPLRTRKGVQLLRQTEDGSTLSIVFADQGEVHSGVAALSQRTR